MQKSGKRFIVQYHLRILNFNMHPEQSYEVFKDTQKFKDIYEIPGMRRKEGSRSEIGE